MQIVTPARSFLLMAEQEEELQYWLKGLNNYLEKQKEQKTDLLKKSQNDQPQQPINQNSQVEERYQEEISTLNSELRDLRAQLKSYQPIIDNYRNDSIKEQLTQKESELEQSNSKLQRVTQVLQSHCDQLYSVLPKLEIAESKINKLEKENEQLLNIVKHIEEKTGDKIEIPPIKMDDTIKQEIKVDNDNIQVDELSALKKELRDKDVVLLEQVRRIEDLEIKLKNADRLMITL